MGNAPGKDEFRKQVTKECSSYFDQLELLSQGIKASALVQNKLIQQIVEEKQLEDEVNKQLTDNEGGKTEAKCGTMNVLSGEAETMNVLSRDVETAVSPKSPRVVVRNFSQEALMINEDCLLKQAETMILTVNSFRNKFEKVAYDIATSGSPETSLYRQMKEKKKAKEALINIQTELDMNKKMVLELSNEVEQKNRQLYVPVQLYFPPSNDQTHDAFQQIKDILTGKFSSLNKGVAVTVCTRPEELSEYKASLVFCVHVSRLGEDVSNCVKGITLSPLKGLVILHHKEERALPQHGSDRVLTAPEYKHLGRIFDMAFWSGKGVYDCQMNTLAIKNIMIFLQNIHDQYLGKSQ